MNAPLPERLPDLVPADRKVVLARMLAEAEAARLQLSPTPDEVHAMTRWWRGEYALCELETFARWLNFAGLELADFQRLMGELVALKKLLDHHEGAIETRLRDHLALHSVRAFHAETSR